jgi:hypothetical protein
MLIDRTHRPWLVGTLIAAAVLTASYVLYLRASPDGPRGGSIPGLLYGIAGAVLMLGVGLISVRKRLARWPIGRARTWLRAHIWLGLLAVLLILFHAGFRFGGPLETVLMLVLVAIVVSGLFGLVMQKVITHQMTVRVPMETFFDQVEHVCRDMQLEADVLVARLTGPLPMDPLPEGVASLRRLDSLNVPGRQLADKLKVVYQTAEQASASAEARPAARRPSTAAPQAPPAGQPAAAADAGAQPASARPQAMAGASEPVVAEPSAPQSAAKPQSTVQPATSEAPSGAGKALSAKEKIALMRAKSQAASSTASAASSRPASEPTAAPSASPVATEPPPAATATLEPPAAAPVTRSESQSPGSTPPASDSPPVKKLSVAEKIALMKASKKAAAEAGAAAGLAEATTTVQGGAPQTAAAVSTAAPAESPGQAPPSPTAATPAVAKQSAAAVAAAKPATSPALAARAKAGAKTTPGAKATPAKPSAVKPLDESWKEATPAMRQFYLHEVREFLGPRFDPRHRLADEIVADEVFGLQAAGLPGEFSACLGQLAFLCDQRRQLARQVRLHRWLHGWLLVHLPLSTALLGLAVVHIVMSLYY